MDNDNEEEQMFTEIFEEEMTAAAQDEEYMLILTCLSGLYREKAIGRHGGSAPGRRKCCCLVRGDFTMKLPHFTSHLYYLPHV
jgi:hypothetical protein